jgi:hypothetical protein
MTNKEYQERIAAANGDYGKMLEAHGEYVANLLMAHEVRCLIRHEELLKAMTAQQEATAAQNERLKVLEAGK